MTNELLPNCSSVHGTRSLLWGGESGGIAGDQSPWAVQLPEAVAFGVAVTSKGYCYVLGSYGTLHAINVESGQSDWTLSLPLEGIKVSDFRVVEDFLIVEFFIINLETRTIDVDLRKCVKDFALKSGSPIEVQDSKIYRVVDSKLAPGKILVFDLESRKSTLIDVGMINLCMPDANNIVGWRKEANTHVLSKYKTGSEVLEVLSNEVKLGRLVLEGNEILTFNRSEIALLDVHNGSLVWRVDLPGLVSPVNPELAMQFKIAICGDAIYIEQSGHLIAVDRSSGKALWSKQYERVHDICIVGDLLYGISDDHTLIALDRYSGHDVWSQQVPCPWASVKAIDNKLLFISASGDVICFEWETSKPYVSPERAVS